LQTGYTPDRWKPSGIFGNGVRLSSCPTAMLSFNLVKYSARRGTPALRV
jgi:hypothetical protein